MGRGLLILEAGFESLDRSQSYSECMSVWLDGLLWEQEAVGSNPTIPTIFAERGASLASTHDLKCCTALTDCEN